MAKKLGKIERPSAEKFKSGRKLYLVPLLYCGAESSAEYLKKYNRYWAQVENQISDLEAKLGKVNRVYHELIPEGGAGGCEAIRELNEQSYQIIKARLDKGAQLEALEKADLLTEFLDWSKCLAVGLQNEQVLSKVYESYTAASKQRNEHIMGQIDATLQANEIGILLMREGHLLQFPTDIQVFYVAPPALDEVKRWLREQR